MLAIKIARSSVKVLLASVGQIRNLTIAHQNLAAKLSEAFVIASKEVTIYVGSGPCSVICAATHLIKLAMRLWSLIRALSLVYPNL